MEIRFAPDPVSSERLTTEEVRKHFVAGSLFQKDAVNLIYSDVDRAIIGGIVPVTGPLPLLASKKELAADYFCERREAGVINTGGAGIIRVDGTDHRVEKYDVLYIGKGSREVLFSSVSPADPAHFFLMSYPAHAAYPVTLATFKDAEPQHLGSQKDANMRTIYKYIHPNGVKSCQLVMGMTMLKEGSIWNTMPSHTHLRRSEVYLYFDLPPEAMVVHLMGEPQKTRNIIMRNRQAVISPSWSIHSGAGTTNYSFVWAMGGENQEFGDMDMIPTKDLL